MELTSQAKPRVRAGRVPWSNGKEGSVYVLIDPRDKTIRYVGWTADSLTVRLRQHRNSKDDTHRYKWIALLARLNLAPIIQVVQFAPIEFRIEVETYWIQYYRSIGCRLTNATDGGDGLFNPTEEIRLKISNALKGRIVSDTTRRKQSVAQTLRAQSPGEQERRRTARRGIIHTPETRARMSAQRSGKPRRTCAVGCLCGRHRSHANL